MPIKTISLSDFAKLSKDGAAPEILDVRTPAEFARLHAAGARSLPLDDLNPPLIAKGADPQRAIYVICQSGGRAAKACERLEQAGVENVFSIEGGTAAWEKAGMPVVRGSGGIISLERQVRIGAGSLVVIGVVLAWTVHRAFLALPAFVGAGLVFAGVTDYCGMAMALAKMPWNRR